MPQIKSVLLQLIANPLRGKTPFASVFWASLGFNIVYSLLGSALGLRAQATLAAYYLVGLAIGVVESAMLWQCAPNSRYVILPAIVRPGVLLSMLAAPYIAYLIIAEPQLIVAP